MTTIYESRHGRIQTSFFQGLSVTLYPHQVTRRPPRWLRSKLPKIVSELEKYEYNISTQPDAAEALWEFVIDILRSPPGGLLQTTVAMRDPNIIAQLLISEIDAARFG